MLADFHDYTYPQAAEAADILDGYAVMVDGALAELPQQIGAMAYLPTERVRRACDRAADLLFAARDALDHHGQFLAAHRHNGCWCHPVDVARWAIEAVSAAYSLAQRHQADSLTPPRNRVLMAMVAEAIRLADEDLRGLLGPVVEQLSPCGRQT